MNINIKKIISYFSVIFVSCFLFLTFFNPFVVNAKEGNPITVYIFHGETCPHCKKELGYLDTLSQKYNFELKKYEVYYDKNNQDLMGRFAKAYNANFNGVPVTIVGYEYVFGENLESTEQLIKKYGAQTEYVDPYQVLLNYEKSGQLDPNVIKYGQTKTEDVSILGGVKLKDVGPIVFGVILGVVDGINPCMFGVLIFLLTHLISIGSKRKVIISGLIFVSTVFIFYYSVMFGLHNLLFNMSVILPYVGVFKVIIGVLALFFAALEIKDFFFYGQGLTLRIPKFSKPIIELIGRRGTYLSAFILAIFSSLVASPCAIGIPLTYIAATKDSINVLLTLLIYNLAFIVPSTIIVLTVFMSSDKIKNGEKLAVGQEKYKKYMRLFAGIVLLIMGFLLILGKI